MAIEDAAVIGNLLSRICDISQLGPLLKAYQDLRLPRTAIAQALSRGTQRVFHLPDGPEQKERDEKAKRSKALELSGIAAEPRRQRDGNQTPGLEQDDTLVNYDADAEVDKWWISHGNELEVLRRSKL